MKEAFAAWENRIAPVFDVVQQIHLVEAEAGQVMSETQELLAEDLPVQKALRLAELGVGTLVCGAISRALHEMAAANGIRIISLHSNVNRRLRHSNSRRHDNGNTKQYDNIDFGSWHQCTDGMYQHSDYEYHVFYHRGDRSGRYQFTYRSSRRLGCQCSNDKRNTNGIRHV